MSMLVNIEVRLRLLLQCTYRSGPFKHNKRLSQIRAGGRSKSRLISAGSQISTGVGRQLSILQRFHDNTVSDIFAWDFLSKYIFFITKVLERGIPFCENGGFPNLSLCYVTH